MTGVTGIPDSAFERAVGIAKPAIDYCTERGYTLLYTANGPEPAMCVRLAVRDANMLRAEVEALRATVARVEALADNASRVPVHTSMGNCGVGTQYRRVFVHADDLREALRGDES